MNHPIYIPSRARPDCPTPGLLRSSGIENFRLVIDAADAEAYAGWKDKLVVVPEDGRGIGYARRYAKWHSTKQGHSHHWQIDDDATGFLVRIPGEPSQKTRPDSALRRIESVMETYANIGIAGFNQNSWPPRGRLEWNAFPVQGILIKNAVRSNYRSDLKILEDLDFNFQVLREGWSTVLFDHVRIVTPASASRPGGCRNIYDAIERKREAVERCKSYWPGLKIDFSEDGKVKIHKKKFMRQFSNNPYSR